MSKRLILKVGFAGNIFIMLFMQLVILGGFFIKSEVFEEFVFVIKLIHFF